MPNKIDATTKFRNRVKTVMAEMEASHKRNKIASRLIVVFPHDGKIRPIERFLMFLFRFTKARLDQEFINLEKLEKNS